MSPSGLMRFVAGTRPYGPTRLKLSERYCRNGVGDNRSDRDVLIDRLVSRSASPLRGAREPAVDGADHEELVRHRHRHLDRDLRLEKLGDQR